MDWSGFLKEVKKEPKNFAEAIVNYLKPPKYAIEELKSFEWMCHFCWKPRVDECFLCRRNICEEHNAKTFVGPKTKLEWYTCPDCLRVHEESEITSKVEEHDEELWQEEQEESS